MTDVLLIPVALTTLLERAEERHAAAQSAGEFDLAERWLRIRDALVDLVYESGRGR